MIMEIVKFPDKRLRQKCRELTVEELKNAIIPEVGKPLGELVKDMVETMVGAEGLGLAAPQVGIPIRLFVMRIEDSGIAIVNPVLSGFVGVQNLEEGCLSIPGVRVRTERNLQVTLNSPQLAKGWKLRALMAACVQHECDHLDGVLIMDNPRHKFV